MARVFSGLTSDIEEEVVKCNFRLDPKHPIPLRVEVFCVQICRENNQIYKIVFLFFLSMFYKQQSLMRTLNKGTSNQVGTFWIEVGKENEVVYMFTVTSHTGPRTLLYSSFFWKLLR